MKVYRKQVYYLLFLALTLVAIYSGPAKAVSATEVEGGAVQTNGSVSFYKEESKSSSSESVTATSASNMSKGTKPVGRYPSTGERIQKSWIFLGLLVLLLVFFLRYFIKRKRQKKGV